MSSDVVAPFGIDSIRVDSNFMFVGMSRDEEGIVKVYNLAAGGTSHQLTGHKVGARATSHMAVGQCTHETRVSFPPFALCVIWGALPDCVLPFPLLSSCFQGQVYSMAFANNTLFTAGQDTTIRVWTLNEQAGIFVSQVGAR